MCLHCCRNRHHGNCYFLLLRKAITPQPFHGVSPHLCLQAASSVFFCLHTRFNHMLFISACISGVLFLYWLMLQLIFLHAPSFASLEETFPPLSDGVNQALSGLGCNVGSCSFFFFPFLFAATRLPPYFCTDDPRACSQGNVEIVTC